VLALALAASLGIPLKAQTTFATITGLVTDASGASIPNAKVSATNLETNITISAVSNDSGNYTLPELSFDVDIPS
jgi:hypothetical protein